MPIVLWGLLALAAAWCMEGGHKALIMLRVEVLLLLIGGVCLGIAVNDLIHYLF